MTKQKHIQCLYYYVNVSLRPVSTVYGCNCRSQGKYTYPCDRWPACDAYVSAHDRTHRPMGTPANGDLRHKRILAHRMLEYLQQSRHMERWEVYTWFQVRPGLNDQQARVDMFSDGMCDEVIRLCYKVATPLGNLHSAAQRGAKR